MPGEYDKRFDDLTDIIGTLAVKVNDLGGRVDRLGGGMDELRLEVRDLRNEVRENTTGLLAVKDEVTIVSGQIKSIGTQVIKNDGQITDLTGRVEVLEADVH